MDNKAQMENEADGIPVRIIDWELDDLHRTARDVIGARLRHGLAPRTFDQITRALMQGRTAEDLSSAP